MVNAANPMASPPSMPALIMHKKEPGVEIQIQHHAGKLHRTVETIVCTGVSGFVGPTRLAAPKTAILLVAQHFVQERFLKSVAIVDRTSRVA